MVLEYKVVAESDSRFAGNFDAESLEKTLNAYAADGWRVVDSVLATNVNKSMKAQVLVILERETGG
jgi:hypothetical protein